MAGAADEKEHEATNERAASSLRTALYSSEGTASISEPAASMAL